MLQLYLYHYSQLLLFLLANAQRQNYRNKLPIYIKILPNDYLNSNIYLKSQGWGICRIFHITWKFIFTKRPLNNLNPLVVLLLSKLVKRWVRYQKYLPALITLSPVFTWEQINIPGKLHFFIYFTVNSFSCFFICCWPCYY